MYFLTSLLQNTFENIVAKAVIAYEYFLNLLQYCQRHSIIKLSIMEIFCIFAEMLSISYASDLMHDGKGCIPVIKMNPKTNKGTAKRMYPLGI